MSFAETTFMDSQVDVLSDVLSSLRICGSLLLHESYLPPWAASVPNADQLHILLGIKVGVRVVAFHLVERGHIEISLGSKSELVVEAGEMVICFSGSAHQISQGNAAQAFSIERLITGEPHPFGSRENLVRSTSCICGVFLLHDTHLNPLFAALPPLLHIPISQASRFHNLSGVAALIAQELHQKSLGANYVVERLLEVLCAEAVRSYINQMQPGQTSWLTGLRDPIVGKALAMIHSQPGSDWSVKRLAKAVAMSPSRFAARFTATLGESPMGYVSKWRMNVASRLLDNTEKSISEIATEVGYENLAAFNRAFKRHLSLPPAAWRSCDRA